MKRWVLLSTFVILLAERGGLTQTQVKTMDGEVVKQRLALYKGNDTKREAALMQMFRDAECVATNLTEQAVPTRKQPNVICVLPGTTPETIVIGAHFDHVSDGEGIIDNWSGAALLPSLYQSLAGEARKHTFIFVGFSGEEEGLIGSKFYAEQLSADQLSNIEAMINLDTLGLGPTEVWASQSDPRLVNSLASIAHTMNLPVTDMELNGVGESDEESFIAKKVCALTVHSLTPQTLHVLHRPDDNPAAMHFEDYYNTYRLLAAYLTVLDTGLKSDGHVCTAKPVEAPARFRNRARIGARR